MKISQSTIDEVAFGQKEKLKAANKGNKMSWNYRIIVNEDKEEKWYSIREVYYNDDNEILGYSQEPDIPTGDTVDVLIECLEMMLRAAKKTQDNILIDGKIKCKGWD